MTVRVKQFTHNGKSIQILQLVDCTNHILYMEMKGK